MLLPIDNFLSADTVKQLLSLIEKAPWIDGKQTSGTIASGVKENLQLDDNDATCSSLRNTLLQALSQHPLFISAALPNKIFPPKFNCYKNRGHYGLHTDSSIMYLQNGEPLRTDVSATIFLSDPNSYEGGELMIETQYGAQAVKLDAGSIILYPSNSLHEVKPVTRGQRICAFFWVQSMVRRSQQREYLFELDQSIQALTQDRGNDDNEVRRLSALYHNLLREWAET